MKRRWIILLSVVILLAAAVVGLCYTQRENLKAIQAAQKHTAEELENQIEENRQVIQNTVNQLPEVTVRDLTDEEKEAFQSGDMSAEELVEALTKPVAPSGSGGESNNVPTNNVPADNAPAKEDQYQKDLSALIEKIYILREEFSAALQNMQNEALAEYRAFTEEQLKSSSELLKWASGYLGRATVLEKECDARMDQLIVQIEELMKANGKDLSESDAIYEAYLNEKSLKKAWYISKLKERGLL